MSGAEIYLIAQVVSAGVKYAKTKSEAKVLNQKAHQTEIKGRIDRANYKQQGIEALKEMGATMASTIANAFSGGIDPFKSGETPDVILDYSLRAGIDDFTIARDNATIAMKQSQYQAEQYRGSARDMVKFGKFELATDIAMAGATYSSVGSAPNQTASTSNKFLDPSYSDYSGTGTQSEFRNMSTRYRGMRT
tara:strand:- start:1038 stop:1613 length:576 start_codon:yes stop_codon:yes gene_type:complete